MADSASLDATAPGGTFELWVNFDDAADGDHQIIMASSNRYTGGANDGYEWASQADGDHFFYPWGGDNTNYNLGPNPFTDGQWHHLAVAFDYDQQAASIYVDGVEITYTNEFVPTYWDTLADPADWLWGGNPDRGTRYFDGMMDEIRISDIDRSLAWIQTSYSNQWDAESFISIGAEQSATLTVAEDAANDTTVGFGRGFDDDGDALTYTITAGNVGNAFKIDAATGHIQVNDADAIDFETLSSYTLTIQAEDPEGETDTASVAIAVINVNEYAPVIGGVDTGSVTEDVDPDTDGLLETAGALTITDADAGEDQFVAETVAGTYGSLTIDAFGAWTYESDNTQNAIQELGAGDSLTDTLTVRTADGTTHDVVITIHGANDAPVIGGVDTGSVTEDIDPDTDGLLETAGALTITDTDAGEDLFVAETVAGTYGSLTIDAAGAWTYESDNAQAAIQELGAGDSLTDTLTVRTADGTTHDVVITIHGADDAPVIGGVDTGSVTEDVDPDTDGLLGNHRRVDDHRRGCG